MDEHELRRQQQRNFYLHLSPLEGHEIAEDEGGFTSPSDEAREMLGKSLPTVRGG
jgi:hypothetical protein